MNHGAIYVVAAGACSEFCLPFIILCGGGNLCSVVKDTGQYEIAQSIVTISVLVDLTSAVLVKDLLRTCFFRWKYMYKIVFQKGNAHMVYISEPAHRFSILIESL